MTDQTQTKTKHSLEDLEKLYNEAEQCDSEVFAEMRSNLLLIAGEHYQKKNSIFNRRLRDEKGLKEEQKLRLTKNHVQNICKKYVNNIISAAPGVGFSPKNEGELHDQKVAEIHHAVWIDAKEKYTLDENVDDWCDDFVGVGETWTKIFFDPSGGKLRGHRQAQDQETGQLLYNEDGSPALGDPVFEGEFIFEEIYGFNVLRSPECKNIKKSPYLITRKMVGVEELVAKFPDMKSKIQASQDKTFVVFDPARGGYRKSEKEALLKEIYFKPCAQYPMGYFYWWTESGIMTEGELPGGIFPLIGQPYSKIQTSARGRGPVKHMRPYQAEINRAASKIAEHQITLGDDKLLIQNGTKVSPGTALPGVRSINYTGMTPGILAGRDGSQYLAYMQAQIEELYSVMNVAEDAAPNGQMDPYAMLFSAASKKRAFQRTIKRFERFLIEVAKTYIKLAKHHMPDDAVILAVGSKERVNIPEFRAMDDLCYEVKVEAQSEDLETKMGKQLVLNHLVQYTGTKLDKEDLGKLVRLMPYANMEEGFSDLTIDYDNATNVILALERGEQPQVGQYDNNVYMVRRLTTRMRQADFKFLDPRIQNSFSQLVAQYQQAEQARIEQIQRAEAGFIPTDGYLVVCDLYVPDPIDPLKSKRARVPYSSLQWLLKQLEAQGQGQQELEKMGEGAMAQMAASYLQQRQQGASPGNGMPGALKPTG